ncbi:MAG: histidinol-phosphate transaminase [Clostridiaceae bacterium]|nr:histidinol-phosphate transaminase [Clostridiaceae bacterium]MDY5889885.1 histidinol-phosphate transaminase [Oscillospiraceae bacterium]
MSRFFSEKYSTLVPYTPGEQPQDRKYVKLNTNESPFPPSKAVAEAVEKEAGKLQLYSDPECVALRKKAAEVFGVNDDEIIMTNGSDEVLNFAFMAFADENNPLVFADITYGFYPVFAELNHIPYTEIPLKEDFSLDPADYTAVGKTVVIANPNAPTGLCLSLDVIEEIVKSNPDNVVIVDEAYIDFGGASAVGLTKKYDNLLVTGTFSKSRSMAGARLGFGIGNAKLIADLNTVKYSTNPYNVNRLTAVAGIAALEDNSYYMDNCKIIQENREWTTAELEKLGFTVLPSTANFIFAKSDKIGGEELYLTLKERGILIRHFTKERICDYNRITIGTAEQMKLFIDAVKKILEERK